MLDALIHCSRHRWTLLKLPPRRIERRLSVAAHWFSEQLTRHWAGRTDLLFTSEALNLSDLYRFVPQLLNKPSVVYFHSNQLPEVNATTESPLDLVNLNTAAAATEIWFNSLFHLRSFMARATALVRRHPELSARNPLPPIMGKAQVMLPPLGTQLVHQIAHAEQIKRQRTNDLCRDARRQQRLAQQGDANRPPPRRDIPACDRRPGRRVARRSPAHDAAGSRPIRPRTRHARVEHLPRARVSTPTSIITLSARCSRAAGRSYRIPASIASSSPRSSIRSACSTARQRCLRRGFRIPGTWSGRSHYEEELVKILRKFDPISACRAIDDRIEQLVVSQKLTAEGKA